MTCAILLDLSVIKNTTKIINTESTSTSAFTAIDNTGGKCGTLQFTLTVTTSDGGNVKLIKLPSKGTLSFAASGALTDAGTFNVVVNGGFNSSCNLTSATMNYTYVDPCETTTITP